MDDSLKFVWAYMIENGVVTTGSWNYYGGGWSDNHRYDWRAQEAETKKLRANVKKVGVDWEKTEVPKSTEESTFEGTEAESGRVETLIGKLVLKDGSEYLIGVNSASQRFTSYVKNLAELAADRQRVKDILGE